MVRAQVLRQSLCYHHRHHHHHRVAAWTVASLHVCTWWPCAVDQLEKRRSLDGFVHCCVGDLFYVSSSDDQIRFHVPRSSFSADRRLTASLGRLVYVTMRRLFVSHSLFLTLCIVAKRSVVGGSATEHW